MTSMAKYDSPVFVIKHNDIDWNVAQHDFGFEIMDKYDVILCFLIYYNRTTSWISPDP